MTKNNSTAENFEAILKVGRVSEATRKKAVGIFLRLAVATQTKVCAYLRANPTLISLLVVFMEEVIRSSLTTTALGDFIAKTISHAGV